MVKGHFTQGVADFQNKHDSEKDGANDAQNATLSRTIVNASPKKCQITLGLRFCILGRKLRGATMNLVGEIGQNDC